MILQECTTTTSDIETVSELEIERRTFVKYNINKVEV